MEQITHRFPDIVGGEYAGCWELVQRLYADCFSIFLPDREYAVDDLDSWVRIETGQQRYGDVLVFREQIGKHVGFCLDKRRMLHTTRLKNNVIERYQSILWLDRLQSIYRHKILL